MVFPQSVQILGSIFLKYSGVGVIVNPSICFLLTLLYYNRYKIAILFYNKNSVFLFFFLIIVKLYYINGSKDCPKRSAVDLLGQQEAVNKILHNQFKGVKKSSNLGKGMVLQRENADGVDF